jgi:hypothetical protein
MTLPHARAELHTTSVEHARPAAIAAEEHEDLDGDGGHSDPPQLWAMTLRTMMSANINPPFRARSALPMRRHEPLAAPASAG